MHWGLRARWFLLWSLCGLVAASMVASAGTLIAKIDTMSDIVAPADVPDLIGEIVFEAPPGSSVRVDASGIHGRLYIYEKNRTSVGGVAVPRDFDRVDEFDVDASGLRLGAGSPAGHVLLVLSSDEQAAAAPTLAGSLTALTIRPDMHVLFPKRTGPLSPASNPPRWHDTYSSTAPRIEAQTTGLEAYSGPVEFYAWESTLEIHHRNQTVSRHEAGHDDRQEQVAAPTVNSYVDRYLHFQGVAENLSVTSEGHSIGLWIDSARILTGPGTLALSGASGSVEHQGTVSMLDGDQVELAADALQLRLSSPDELGSPRYSVQIEGEFSYLRVNGAVPGGSDPPLGGLGVGAATALGVVSGVAVLGGLLYYLKLAPLLPTYVLRAGFRYGGQSVLEAMKNPRRRRILRIVQEKPGIQPFYLWKEVGGAFGVALRHLDRLESLGLVRSIKQGRNRHYYENAPEFDGRQAEILAALSTRVLGQTYRTLQERNGATQRELGSLLGLSPSAVSERLSRMSVLGLVQTSRRGRIQVYFPTSMPIPRNFWLSHQTPGSDAATQTTGDAPPAAATPTGSASPLRSASDPSS